MALRLVVWDVQHGSATYIRTPNGKHIVVDLGVNLSATGIFSPLQYLKTRWAVSQLDLAVITHPHLDHIGDILSFDSLSPRVLIRPSHLRNDDIWGGNGRASKGTQQIIEKYIEIDNRYTSPVDPQKNLQDPANTDDVSIQTFVPTLSPITNLNNHSVVTVLSYGSVKILLPGDNEPPSWSELLERLDFRQAIAGVNLLVAPHHGRESGFHSPLFDYFEPLITIISDGRFLDTSATSRYSAVTKGWQVKRRNGSPRERKCVTTRNDGVIDVEVGIRLDGQTTLDVTVD